MRLLNTVARCIALILTVSLVCGIGDPCVAQTSDTLERQGIQLPLACNGLAVAADGKSAFVWTAPPAESGYDRPTLDSSSRAGGAVIDLTRQTASEALPLPFSISRAAVDEGYIYAARHDSQIVAVLDRSTLAVKKQITLDGKIVWMSAAGGNVLAVGLEGARWLKLSVPELTVVADHHSLYDSIRPSHPLYPVDAGLIALDDGYWLPSGDVYDATLTRPVVLAWAQNFVAAYPTKGPRSELLREQGELMMGGMNADGRSKGMAGFVHDRRLAIYALLKRTTNPETDFWSIQLLDPATAAASSKPTIPLGKTTRGRPSEQFTGRFWPLKCAANQLVVMIPRHLFVIPAAELAAGDPADKPLAFVQRQSTILVDAAGSTKLTHAVVGGKAPIQFSLDNPQNGLSIDSPSGAVTVDGPAIVSAALNRHVYPPMPGFPSGGVWGTSQAVDAYVSQLASRFEHFTGRKPAGVPVSLEIIVQAADATPRTTQLRYFVVVDVPRQFVDERINQISAASTTAQAAATAGNLIPETDARIRKIEERFTALDAKLDLILKLLNEHKAK